MKYAKAVVGAIVAGLSALMPGLEDGALSGPEWITAVVAALVALGAVWAVPNTPVQKLPAE